MGLAVDKEMLDRLEAARASALEDRKGLIAGTDRHMVEKPLRRWGKMVEGRSPVTGEPNEETRGFLATLMDHQARYLAGLVLNGSLWERMRVQDMSLFAPKRNLLAETTTSAEIATFTRQVLAFVEPVFERIFIGELVHMRVMQGPTAFVHTLDFRQGSAGTFYAQSTSFQGRLDIDYSDCPAECSNYKKVDLRLVQTLITAVCKGLAADWCLPAEQDYMSQHGRSMADDLRAFMQLQMARERQGEVINELVANAGYTAVWSSTIPAGSVYLNLDPKVYASTLYDALLGADNEIFKAADGYRGSNWIAGTPDALLRLEKLKTFSFAARGVGGPRGTQGNASIDEYGNFFGVANLRWNVWKFPFMTANTLLLGVKSDAPQELGFIHAEYIPLADLGIFRNPENGRIVTGMQSRYANAIIRPSLYATVTIT